MAGNIISPIPELQTTKLATAHILRLNMCQKKEKAKGRKMKADR